MNKKTRSLRAAVAVSSLVLVAFVSGDALAHIRAGAEYRWGMYYALVFAGLALAVLLFTWNVVQYAAYKRRG